MQETAIVATVFGGILGTILALFFGSIILGTFGLWLGGKMVGAPQASFLNALVASVGSSIARFVLATVLLVLPIIGGPLGYLVGLVASVFIVQALFKTDGLKSALCVGIEMVVTWVGLTIIAVTFFGGMTVLLVFLGNVK